MLCGASRISSNSCDEGFWCVQQKYEPGKGRTSVDLDNMERLRSPEEGNEEHRQGEVERERFV